ncbi:MAG TPA: triose-phosphate isomerase, partial [Thermomicrobiales bacterium]|nr:triose-phosphate isomerase [Thermomicrobiales bacterium]
MERPFLFGTNFKMNQTPAESAEFFSALAASVTVPDGVQLFVIPPFTSLPAVTALAATRQSGIWIGAQNMHWAAAGAYTGEISAAMLQALGVDLVLLGHAERRLLFHETDQDVNRKVLTAAERGLRVLLCVGETADERAYAVGGETVARQLTIGLHDLDPKHLPLLQIAYEPVWCIGAGSVAAHPSDVAPIVG